MVLFLRYRPISVDVLLISILDPKYESMKHEGRRIGMISIYLVQQQGAREYGKGHFRHLVHEYERIALMGGQWDKFMIAKTVKQPCEESGTMLDMGSKNRN